MPPQERMTKAAQRTATIQTLVAIGRDVFAEQGFAQASTEDIVQRANLTRGALYHHFAGKEGLFRAVLMDVQRDVAQRIERASAEQEMPWEQLVAGCRTFLTASLDPQVQQIMLIDAPAVLGWEEWRRLDAEYSMRQLHDVLHLLLDAEVIHPLPMDALTHLLSGAMNEAALWIARAEHTEHALVDATMTLEHLLRSLRKITSS